MRPGFLFHDSFVRDSLMKVNVGFDQYAMTPNATLCIHQRIRITQRHARKRYEKNERKTQREKKKEFYTTTAFREKEEEEEVEK